MIIFDKANNRVGFVNQHNQINLYPNLALMTPLSLFFMAMATAATVMILGMRKIKRTNKAPGGKTGSGLTDTLQGGSVEMAVGEERIEKRNGS